MIPAIKQVAGDMFVFQEDSAPAHRARDTIQLLQRETPDFIGPDLLAAQQSRPESRRLQDLGRQQRVYVNNVDELKQRLHDVWHDAPDLVVDGIQV